MDPARETAQKERLRASLARLMESGRAADESDPPAAPASQGQPPPNSARPTAIAPEPAASPLKETEQAEKGDTSPASRSATKARGKKRGRADARKRLEALRERGTQAAGEPLDLSGQNLRRADLRGLDLSFANFAGSDLSQADLRNATLIRANLEGALLYQARLDRAEFTGSNLTGASLERASARQTCFGMACLQDAALFEADLEGATLSKGDLSGADLRCAKLTDTRIREAELAQANFDRADLRGADLEEADVRQASFDDADLRQARLRHIDGFEKANWIGADLRDVDFSGAYLLRRFAMDQNYIEEFKKRSGFHRWVYRAWWLTSDCGRSIGRWMLFTMLTAVTFAAGYRFTHLEYSGEESFGAALYYSVVTLTTLGYGDILPISPAARALSIAEVLVGYLMMGGLLSIFANKMARRAE